MTQTKKYLTWDQTEYPIQWDNNPYTWDEVFVLIEVLETVQGGGGYHDAYKHLEPEKKKTLIKLIAKVKGEKFEEEKYKQNKISVKVEDIELVIKEVLKIEVKKVE